MLYNKTFYDGNRNLSAYSAASVTSSLINPLSVSSVVDFGCAYGVWLRAWKQAGVADICGVDGEFLDQEHLLIKKNEFVAADLSQRIDLGRVFDLAQSLEVAEHLPASAADTLIENLVHHANLVLFSAAPPGQGGIGHINEQSYSYWRDHFATHDFHVFDFVRPQIAQDRRIQPWYRYNTFLYVRADHVSELPEAILQWHLGREKPLPDISPAIYRLRKAIIRNLPLAVQQLLGHWKRRYYAD